MTFKYQYSLGIYGYILVDMLINLLAVTENGKMVDTLKLEPGEGDMEQMKQLA